MATFATGTRTVSDLAMSVRDARLAAGMSQADLAEAAGLTRPWVSLFESGRAPNASLTKVLTMMDVLGITIRLTYPVPEPDSSPSKPVRRSPRKPSSNESAESTDGNDADEPHSDDAGSPTMPGPSSLNEVALAAARAIRESHRARAIADDLTRRSSDA